LQIPESGLVGRLAAAGVVVVAAGGGGIPVARGSDGLLEGIDAVVDKDRASALLALEAGAQRLLILTSTDAVYSGFGTPAQRALPQLTPAEAERLLRAGEFPPGSMGPKIEAALTFLRGGGREVRIGLPEELEDLLAGRAGTVLCAGGGEPLGS
jgi:carbamate kinase